MSDWSKWTGWGGGAGKENWAEGAEVGHEEPGRPVREF